MKSKIRHTLILTYIRLNSSLMLTEYEAKNNPQTNC